MAGAAILAAVVLLVARANRQTEAVVMPVYHDLAHALLHVEAACWAVWLVACGVVVGWVRWGCEMTTVYCVFREGVYRHECVGVFSTKRMAKAVADAAADTEHDDRHKFAVVPFEMDAQYRATAGAYHGFDEPAAVYSKSRGSEDEETYCHANHETGEGEQCQRVAGQRLAGANWGAR